MAPKPPPDIRQALKGGLRSMRQGTGADMIRTYQEMRRVRDEELASGHPRFPNPSREDGWYTKSVERDDTVHLMLDQHGEITESYPHVHVIHDGRRGEVRIVLSRGPAKQDHEQLPILKGNPDGKTVDQAIKRAVAML